MASTPEALAFGHSQEENAESIHQPGKALKPGDLLMLAPPTPKSPTASMERTQELEAMPQDEDRLDSLSPLYPLLKQQHEAVMEAFASQHVLLLQVSNSMNIAPATPVSRSPTTRSGRSRFGAQNSNPKVLQTMKSTDTDKESKISEAVESVGGKSLASERESKTSEAEATSPTTHSSREGRASDRSANRPARGRRPSFTPQGPQLFSTFTHFDLGLQIEAARADGEQSRKRFALMKNVTRSNGEVDDPCIYKVVTHVAFEAFFAVVVIINSLFIGVEVELQMVSNGATMNSEFVRGVQYTFTTLFTLELLMRFLAFGFRRMFCEEDWIWSALDVVIVVSSLWETALDILSSNTNTNISALRAFRIIRLTKILRTMRLIRIFRFVNALRMLITSIFHTLKSLFWALVLICLNVYVFAVLFVQAVVDFKEEAAFLDLGQREADGIARYFSSVLMTMLSLFMSIAGGVSWEDVVMPLMAGKGFCFALQFYGLLQQQ
ncbi:Voltage-dependent calcium channel type A subunit alpha-1 [Symbiodinium microadriaticum]|uniref:Voltage-dependent calcium channel type A subunit alpha-1 n=1 Tax=Symbiodinium microadriaticum TaxID=2951 RepID=A0A1Q9DKS2_SYMMI|nr:Voltage-dependent calcium channel type A subunit alpha-1 [Symbiodinium microadriaticum]